MAEDLKLSLVRRRLEADLTSSDLLFSLLVAALNSYRYDSAVRPFPPVYLTSSASGNRRRSLEQESEDRDFSTLRRDVTQCPDFKSLDHKFVENDRLVDLVLWAIDGKQFSLTTCDKSKFLEIRSLTGHTTNVPAPNYVFEVSYCQTADEKFDSFRNGRPLIYAYHGSRLENFHSILRFGLQGHLNKNSVFGEGTYLSSELSVSIHYSPMGFAWEKSVLGQQMSCVAVCEIIDDPSVKCQLRENGASSERSATQPSNSRARIAGSIGGDVPEKYYVVRNNDVMRVKYLLVYVQKNQLQRRTIRCLQKYKFILMLTLYVVFLVALGLFRSTAIRSYFKRFSSSQ